MQPDHLSDGDYERLARYLAGEGSESERAATRQWVEGDIARRAALEAMQVAWNTPLPPASWDVDAGWGKLSARIAEDAASPRNEVKVIPIELKRRWWHGSAVIMRVAAAAVVIIGGALLLPKMRATDGAGGPPVAASATSSFTTVAGERRSLELPDGSLVALGVSSTLRMRDGYGLGAREVELTGEALFTVVHDEAKPFRVHVGGTVVEDLGTEFAVRGYGDSRSVRVAVASGSVAVRRGGSSDTAVVLAPRDMATIAEAGDVEVRRGVDVSPFTAFSSGRLIFTDTPLAGVAREVERWYGVEVRVTDSAIADKHLTVTFERETLDEVLRIIGMSLDVRYVRNGNRVEFTGTGFSAAPPRVPEAPLAERGA